MTDISRLIEQISDLQRIESESIDGIAQTKTEIEGVEATLAEEKKIYDQIYAVNSAEMTIRQNDLDVFTLKALRQAEVMDTLNSLLEEACTQLDQARATETANVQNFEMLKQALTDEIKFANKEMSEAKTKKSEAEASKATAKGDLEATHFFFASENVFVSLDFHQVQ